LGFYEIKETLSVIIIVPFVDNFETSYVDLQAPDEEFEEYLRQFIGEEYSGDQNEVG
jgi:hypothetical protein